MPAIPLAERLLTPASGNRPVGKAGTGQRLGTGGSVGPAAAVRTSP